jgi:hypothetical protein
MKKSLILFVLIISGCSSEVEPWELQQSINYCQEPEKISAISITNGIFFYSSVVCVSGKRFKLIKEDIQ